MCVDIGASKLVMESAFVRSRVDDMEWRGFKAIWQDLPVREYMRGVGKGSVRCSRAVHLVGALHDGTFIGYISPVFGKPSITGVRQRAIIVRPYSASRVEQLV